jgi:hypothetical protein
MQMRFCRVPDSALSHVEGPERSPTGEATDLLPFAFAVDFFFRVFSPKIACQAPKPPKPHKAKRIELAG